MSDLVLELSQQAQTPSKTPGSVFGRHQQVLDAPGKFVLQCHRRLPVRRILESASR